MGVLAGVGAVDEVIGTHDGAHSRIDGAGEGRQVPARYARTCGCMGATPSAVRLLLLDYYKTDQRGLKTEGGTHM